MQHKRQETESEPFSKRRKLLTGELSPTDSGYGDSELEQDHKLLDSPPSDAGWLESPPYGTVLLEEHKHRKSTDSDYVSDGCDGQELDEELKEHDEELKEHDYESPGVFGRTNVTEPLEEHKKHDSENAYCESTHPDSLSGISGSTQGSELFEENKEHDSESLPRVFGGTNVTEPLEDFGVHDSEKPGIETTGLERADSPDILSSELIYCEPTYPDSLSDLSDPTQGSDLLEENKEQDSESSDTESADSESLPGEFDEINAPEVLDEYGSEYSDRESTDSESLPAEFDGTDAPEVLEEHSEHGSEYSYTESTDYESLPAEFDGTDAPEVLEEHSEHGSEYSCTESTDLESLPAEFDETNAPEVPEEHGSEYSYTESIGSEYFSGETNVIELKEYKKFNSEYSERESTESLDSLEKSEQVNDTDLLKINLSTYRSLNEYLWQPRFNDDSSYENNAYETEEQQFERAICNSLIENIPDKREVKRKRRRSRVYFEENETDSRRVRFEENETNSKRVRLAENEMDLIGAHFAENQTDLVRARFAENKTDSKRVRFEENETDSKRVRFEENETDSKIVCFEEIERVSIASCSEFRSNDDYIFSQFNVTGDFRTSHPEKFLESSEELSRKGHYFLPCLLRSMTTKDQVGTKIDEEVRNLVQVMKEKMRGDKCLQIHWLAACLLQLYTDMHKQLDGVLEFSKRTGGELDMLYDKMAEMSTPYLQKAPDCYLFQDIMDHLDGLQVEWFLNKSEGMENHFNALKVLANVMKGLYEKRLSHEDSDEEAYLNLSGVIGFFCPLMVNLCDTAFLIVKKCKEFYRVRNYVLSRLRKN